MEEHIENIERHLIHDLKQGSHKAFDKIYQMYSKRLYAYSLQFTKSSEESEEIVQEVQVFLEDFYNSLCLRKFERKNKFEVTNWRPFHFLCFAVNRYQRHSS